MKDTVTLGSTGIVAHRNGFGALPVQRVSDEEAVRMMHRAYEAGVNYYDTARSYTDSEHKLGLAFSDIRDRIFIASKTMAETADTFWSDLERSLRELKTDYIDVYQLHNPPFMPKPGDESGLYDAMLEAKRQGLIRHIGFTNHRLAVALEAAKSGLYEVIQYPFSYLASEEEIALVELCAQKNVGYVAMKGLSGGLISNTRGAYAYIAQYPGVLPIWGTQHMWELEEFIAYRHNPPSMDDPAIRADIERDRAELVGGFCRACGYCAPCPVGIDITQAARMKWFAKRSGFGVSFSQESRENMAKVPNCIECRQCVSRCPYDLDIPTLIKHHYTYYKQALAERI